MMLIIRMTPGSWRGANGGNSNLSRECRHELRNGAYLERILCSVDGAVVAGTYVQLSDEGAAMSERKQQVIDLLKSLETGDPKPIAYINPNKYIQHNLAVGDGMAGLGVLFASLPKGATTVNTVRAFEDGDFVFVHTE